MKKLLALLLATLLALSFMSCDPSTPKADNTNEGTGGDTTQSTTLTEVEVTARTMDLFIAASSESSGTASEASRSTTSISPITITIDEPVTIGEDILATGSKATIEITDAGISITIEADVTLSGAEYKISGKASATINTTDDITVANDFTLAINGIEVKDTTISALMARVKRFSSNGSLADSEIGKRVGALIMEALNSGSTELVGATITFKTTYTNDTNGDAILAEATAQFIPGNETTTIRINAKAILDVTTFTLSGSATIAGEAVKEHSFTINAKKVSDTDATAIIKAMGLLSSSSSGTEVQA